MFEARKGLNMFVWRVHGSIVMFKPLRAWNMPRYLYPVGRGAVAR